MANHTPAQTPPFAIALVFFNLLLLGAVAGGLAWEWRQKINRTNIEELRRIEDDSRIRKLETGLAAAEARLAAVRQDSAKAPTSAQDRAVAAQISALNAAMASLAESQKMMASKWSAPTAIAAAPAATQPVPSTPRLDAQTPAVASPAAPAPRTAPPAINTLEAAYKQAWESDKPVVVGQVKDPLTGQLTGGRTLDPAGAKSIGVITWREWYLSEEQSRREELAREAQVQAVANQERLAEIPKNPPR